MNSDDYTLAQLLAQRNKLQGEIGRYRTLVLMAMRWAKHSEQWRKAWHPVRMMALDGQKRAVAELAEVQQMIRKKQKTLL